MYLNIYIYISMHTYIYKKLKASTKFPVYLIHYAYLISIPFLPTHSNLH